MKCLKYLHLSIILVLVLLMGACSSVTKRQNILLQKQIYAINDSVRGNRFDLAKKYSDQSIRLVPPPKNKIIVKPFITKDKNTGISKNYVVLPENTKVDEHPVIAADSTQFNQEISQDAELKKQVAAENKDVGKLDRQVDKVLVDKQKIVDKEENRPNIFIRIIHIFKFGGIFGVIAWGIGLVVVLLVFPEFLPVFLHISFVAVKWFFGLFGLAFAWLLATTKGLKNIKFRSG